MHKLKITNCKNHIEEITLTEGTHTIGRFLDSTLRLEGDEVSRLHARLLVNQTECVLIDEGSKNGTFINGNRITSHHLHNDDIIKIGRFNLQFVSDNAKPYIPEKNGAKLRYFLILGFIIFTGLFFYHKMVVGKAKLQLANRTAQYLAERNKEALYLGEYSSLDLTSLPSEIINIAIWDRSGTLRVYQPPGVEPLIDIRGDVPYMRRNRKTLEVYTPICCESVRVGTLWMKYRL